MGHKIAEAIIEDGQIKYVNKNLPPGRLKVHLIFDTGEAKLQESDVTQIVSETSGIYKEINADIESNKLRLSWERNGNN